MRIAASTPRRGILVTARPDVNWFRSLTAETELMWVYGQKVSYPLVYISAVETINEYDIKQLNFLWPSAVCILLYASRLQYKLLFCLCLPFTWCFGL